MAVLAPYPNLTVYTKAAYKDQVNAQINQLLYLVYTLLGLAVIIAIFGIVNTLALSIFERTREIGLLRAVGLTRRATRAMIRWEAIIVALIGGVVGLVLGAFIGIVIVQRISLLTTLSVPWGSLVVFLVLAGVAGVVAAIFPARRAARLRMSWTRFSRIRSPAAPARGGRSGRLVRGSGCAVGLDREPHGDARARADVADMDIVGQRLHDRKAPAARTRVRWRFRERVDCGGSAPLPSSVTIRVAPSRWTITWTSIWPPSTGEPCSIALETASLAASRRRPESSGLHGSRSRTRASGAPYEGQRSEGRGDPEG